MNARLALRRRERKARQRVKATPAQRILRRAKRKLGKTGTQCFCGRRQNGFRLTPTGPLLCMPCYMTAKREGAA